MVNVGSLAALAVSAVFCYSSLAKLRSLGPTRIGFISMRLPGALVVPVVLVELIASGALLLAPRLGGVVAIVLLTVFTVVLVRAQKMARARGSKGIRCNCFGSAAEITGWTFVRNGLLLLLAIFALVPTQLQLNAPSLLTAGMVVGGVELLRQIGKLRMATGAFFPRVPNDADHYGPIALDQR